MLPPPLGGAHRRADALQVASRGHHGLGLRGYERHVLLLTGPNRRGMGPRPPRWCPGAAIKTATDIQTDYSYYCDYTYFLNDPKDIYGLAVFTVLSTRPRKVAERVNGHPPKPWRHALCGVVMPETRSKYDPEFNTREENSHTAGQGHFLCQRDRCRWRLGASPSLTPEQRSSRSFC